MEKPEIPEADTPPASKNGGRALKIEKARQSLLARLASSTPNTVVERTAWVLNNYPEARNSDVTLQLRYWKTFCPDRFTGGPIHPDLLYELPRLTTLSRSRATVQNTFRLFLADEEVQRRRGTLSEEERDDAIAASDSAAPVYAVFVDESGKTHEHLLVGSLWILHGPETLRIARKLREWRASSGFGQELHFTDVQAETLPHYKTAIDVVVDNASALSLKYIAVPRAGAGKPPQVIPRLIYHLVVKGIWHEHDSGRAPLPRNLQLWKDAEEESADKLVLADLKDRLRNAAVAQFEHRLVIDVVAAADSKTNDLLQVADLFVASLNRLLNPPDPPPKAEAPKDELAKYVVARTGVSLGEERDDAIDDLAVRLKL